MYVAAWKERKSVRKNVWNNNEMFHIWVMQLTWIVSPYYIVSKIFVKKKKKKKGRGALFSKEGGCYVV